MCGSKKSSAARNSTVSTSRFLHSKVAASRIARASRMVMGIPAITDELNTRAIASSFNQRGYEHDNGYNTRHLKRSGLCQVHYKNDCSLAEGIRKQKRETIWQSTLSFLPSRR